MEIITLIIAIWGAVISTILGVRELTKDKRSLKIILELMRWQGGHRIVITNTGHRPITIDQVSVSICLKRLGIQDHVPPGHLRTQSDERLSDTLPQTLEDGKMMVVHLSQTVSNELDNKNSFLRIEVFDAEGKIYSKYSKGEYDSKYGYRAGVTKRPGFIRERIDRLRGWWLTRRYLNDQKKKGRG